jgi:hypothetical protein
MNDPKPVNTNNRNNRKNTFRKRNRRGAITYKNAARIRGIFQKPPIHPYRSKYVPIVRHTGPLYMNNNDPQEEFY